MKVINTCAEAKEVVMKAQQLAAEQDMWSISIFHEDKITHDVWCEVSLFDTAFRRDQYVTVTKKSLDQAGVNYLMYEGASLISDGGILQFKGASKHE